MKSRVYNCSYVYLPNEITVYVIEWLIITDITWLQFPLMQTLLLSRPLSIPCVTLCYAVMLCYAAYLSQSYI